MAEWKRDRRIFGAVAAHAAEVARAKEASAYRSHVVLEPVVVQQQPGPSQTPPGPQMIEPLPFVEREPQQAFVLAGTKLFTEDVLALDDQSSSGGSDRAGA